MESRIKYFLIPLFSGIFCTEMYRTEGNRFFFLFVTEMHSDRLVSRKNIGKNHTLQSPRP